MKKNDNPTTGGLYLVPSPLGNLGDLTLRAVETLKRADLVVAEDTRRTLQLLNHLQLRKPLQSYRAQNHHRAWPKISQVLAEGGQVSLVTDAGCPVISDPGAELVASCREAGFPVVSLPGPSAVTCALAASGFSGDRFIFAGFLPTKGGDRRQFITKLKDQAWTLVFFETPHRLAASLTDLAAILGNRPALLAREMTKMHEEFYADTLSEMATEVTTNPRRGEMTIVVEGRQGELPTPPLDLERVRELARNDSRPVKVLAALLAEEGGRSRGEMYKLLLEARQSQVESD